MITFRKSKILCIAGVLVVVLVALGAGEGTRKPAVLPQLDLPDGYRQGSPESIRLVWPAKIPHGPSKVKVFRTVHPRLTPAWERMALNALGGGTASRSSLEVTCSAVFDGWRFTMYKGGAMRLGSIKKVSTDQKRWPDAHKSEEIARRFLKRRGLWEDNASLRGVADNTKGSGVMSVGFKCTIGGIPVEGPGARIIVGVDSSGKVKSVYKSWPKLEEVGEYPIISAEEAIRKFKKGEGYFPWKVRGRVKSFRLTYYAPPGMECEHLLPAYLVIYVAPDSTEELRGRLPAIEDRFLEKPNSGEATTQPADPNS